MAVGRPARAGIVAPELGQALRLRPRRGQIEQPQAVRPLLASMSVSRSTKATCGRRGNLRIADALEAHQIIDGERAAARTAQATGASRRRTGTRRACTGAARVRTGERKESCAFQPTSPAAMVQGSCCAACSHSCSAASSSTLAMYQRAVCEMLRAIGVEAQHDRRVHRVSDGVLAEQPGPPAPKRHGSRSRSHRCARCRPPAPRSPRCGGCGRGRSWATASADW